MAPSFLNPTANSCDWQIKPLTPFNQWQGNTVQCQHYCSMRISHLLSTAFPTTIFRFIISIIVNASKSQSDRTHAHVGKKVIEMRPRIANFYSSSSIVLEAFMSWSATTFKHLLPTPVGGCARTCVTMLSLRYCNFYTSLNTPGRHNVASINVVLAACRWLLPAARCEFTSPT